MNGKKLVDRRSDAPLPPPHSDPADGVRRLAAEYFAGVLIRTSRSSAERRIRIPAAADRLAVQAVIRPRPFWAFYYDPETIYLYDGLRLLRGQTPVNTDNPATVVQLLSAAILAPLAHTPFVIDTFRSAAYVVALALNAAAVYLLMRTVLRDTPELVRIAAVWGFLAFPAVLEYNTVWSPIRFIWPWGASASPQRGRTSEGPRHAPPPRLVPPPVSASH